MSPSLTVCCATAEPARRVAAVLTPLRSIADEVVLAADARVSKERLQAYQQLADRVFTFEFAEPIERVWPWLHAQCRGDWIFQIDGDEIASTALLEVLPNLVKSRDVAQFNIARWWLYPDATTWLAGPPHGDDHLNRLVRNDPTTMWYPGLSHSCAEPSSPARFVCEPIYHLVCVTADRRQRLDKVGRYLALPRGLQQPGSSSDVRRFYLPEEGSGLPLMPVPDADRQQLEAAIVADDDVLHQCTNTTRPVTVATREDVDRYWPLQELAPTDYQARIRCFSYPAVMIAGQHRPFWVRVQNGGSHTWPGLMRSPLIRVAYRWLDASGNEVVGEGFRSAFPASVAAGTEAVLPAWVAAPTQPGTYQLELDLVHEHVRWFGCRETVEIRVAATAAPTELIHVRC